MKNNNEEPHLLKLDAIKNSLDYLEESVKKLIETDNNPIAWKWVIIAIHGALYGFGVCASQGTDCYSIVERDKEGKPKMINGRYKLLSFDKILKRCQNKVYMEHLTYSKALELSKDQKSAISFIKDEFRNNFEHFIPKHWLIELDGIPKMIASCYEVIQFLAIDCGTIYISEKIQDNINSLCQSGKSIALASKCNTEHESQD